MKHRPKRKQPRRLTPPLFLKGDSGERIAIEVDQEHLTTERLTSTRTTAILVLTPGLRVEIGSRCINKRRVPVLRISAQGYTPEPPQVGDAFRQINDPNNNYAFYEQDRVAKREAQTRDEKGGAINESAN